MNVEWQEAMRQEQEYNEGQKRLTNAAWPTAGKPDSYNPLHLVDAAADEAQRRSVVLQQVKRIISPYPPLAYKRPVAWYRRALARILRGVITKING